MIYLAASRCDLQEDKEKFIYIDAHATLQTSLVFLYSVFDQVVDSTLYILQREKKMTNGFLVYFVVGYALAGPWGVRCFFDRSSRPLSSRKNERRKDEKTERWTALVDINQPSDDLIADSWAAELRSQDILLFQHHTICSGVWPALKIKRQSPKSEENLYAKFVGKSIAIEGGKKVVSDRHL